MSAHEPDATRAAVASVVQNLAAARLGRGFVPLGAIFLFGVVQMVLRGWLESDYAFLATGSVAAGAGMLLYGNGAVRRALSRKGHAAATAAGIVPYVFTLWVLGSRGLRPLADIPDLGWGPFVLALVFVGVTGRLLWHLTRLTELHRLALSMTEAAPGERD